MEEIPGTLLSIARGSGLRTYSCMPPVEAVPICSTDSFREYKTCFLTENWNVHPAPCSEVRFYSIIDFRLGQHLNSQLSLLEWGYMFSRKKTTEPNGNDCWTCNLWLAVVFFFNCGFQLPPKTKPTRPMSRTHTRRPAWIEVRCGLLFKSNQWTWSVAREGPYCTRSKFHPSKLAEVAWFFNSYTLRIDILHSLPQSS